MEKRSTAVIATSHLLTSHLPSSRLSLCYNEPAMSQAEPRRRTIDPFSRELLEFPAVIDLLHGYLSGPISEPAAGTG